MSETPEPQALHEFFAVTLHTKGRSVSIYRVTDKDSENKRPVVEKIALRGESGIPVGQRLNSGTFVGIRYVGLWLFGDESFQKQTSGKRRHSEEVEEFYQKGHTSPLVALFLTEDKA